MKNIRSKVILFEMKQKNQAIIILLKVISSQKR